MRQNHLEGWQKHTWLAPSRFLIQKIYSRAPEFVFCLFVLFFFFWLSRVAYRISFPQPGVELGLRHWKPWILTIGLSGSSPEFVILISLEIMLMLLDHRPPLSTTDIWTLCTGWLNCNLHKVLNLLTHFIHLSISSLCYRAWHVFNGHSAHVCEMGE